MTKVIMGASMSLDGYIAGPNESGFDHLFAWHNNGDAAIPSADERWTFHPGKGSEPVVRGYMQAGPIVCGRRLFDITQSWNGSHPLGTPIFVVTHNVPTDWPHPDAPVTLGNPRVLEGNQVTHLHYPVTPNS